jgi:hypothetical protein
VRHKDQAFPGEHEGIVDSAVFDDVQALLRKNHRTGGAAVRNKYGALLKGLLRCSACDCSMAHSHSTRDKKKQYRNSAIPIWLDLKAALDTPVCLPRTVKMLRKRSIGPPSDKSNKVDFKMTLLSAVGLTR